MPRYFRTVLSLEHEGPEPRDLYKCPLNPYLSNLGAWKCRFMQRWGSVEVQIRYSIITCSTRRGQQPNGTTATIAMSTAPIRATGPQIQPTMILFSLIQIITTMVTSRLQMKRPGLWVKRLRTPTSQARLAMLWSRGHCGKSVSLERRLRGKAFTC